MHSANTPYIARLDHLRLYAALMVLMFHFFHFYIGTISPRNPLLTLIDEGHVGVGLFMVVSGFIFSHIAYGKTLDYARFLFNRAVRILPLYLFAVLLATYTARLDHPVSDILATFFAVKGTVLGPFPQLWTVAAEFQFYLIFPFLHRFLDRFGSAYALGLIALLLLLRGMIFVVYGTVQDLAYHTLFGRLDQFLIGMVLGRKYSRKAGLLSNPIYLILAIATVFGVVQWFGANGGFYGRGFPSPDPLWIFWPAAEGAMWGFLLLSYVNCRFTLGAWMEQMLAKIGATSFSVYIFHLLVIMAFTKLFNIVPVTPNFALNVILTGIMIVVPSTLMLAALTYHLIERPFLTLRRRYVGDSGEAPAARAGVKAYSSDS